MKNFFVSVGPKLVKSAVCQGLMSAESPPAAPIRCSKITMIPWQEKKREISESSKLNCSISDPGCFFPHSGSRIRNRNTALLCYSSWNMRLSTSLIIFLQIFYKKLLLTYSYSVQRCITAFLVISQTMFVGEMQPV